MKLNEKIKKILTKYRKKKIKRMKKENIMAKLEEKIYRILALELHPLNRALTIEPSYYLFLMLNREKQTIKHIDLDFTEFVNYMHDKFGSAIFHLQDFIPEADEGKIKYFYNKQEYKIFCGTGLEDTYDWLQQFEIIYSSLEKFSEETLRISPMKFFSLALLFQDHTLNILIENNEYVNSLSKKLTINQSFESIGKGWFESLKSALVFKKSDLRFILDEAGFNSNEKTLFYNNFVIEIKENAEFNITAPVFIKKLWSGQIDSYWFIKIKNLYYLRPKKISEVLINNFAKFFMQNFYTQKTLDKMKKDLILQLSNKIHKNIDHIQVIIQNHTEDREENKIESDLLLVVDGFYLLPINITLPLKETEADLTAEVEKLTINSDLINPTITGHDGKTLNGLKGDYVTRIRKDNIFPFIVTLVLDFKNYILSINKENAQINVINLSDFLGFIEEIDNKITLIKFLQQYRNLRRETTLPPYSTLCEVFSIFKSRDNCLSFGGKPYHYMVTAPHSWSYYRYDSLSRKWANLVKFKKEEKPFTWRFNPIGNNTYIAHIPNTNLVSKVFVLKNKTFIWFMINTKYFEEKELIATELLVDMLSYYFSKMDNFLSEELKQYKYIHFYFYSTRILREHKKDFDYVLSHIQVDDLEKPYSFISNNMYSSIDFGIIFNKEKIINLFNGTQSSNNNEIFFVKTVLHKLGVNIPDNLLTSFTGKPRNVIRSTDFPISLKEMPKSPLFPVREDECNADNLTFKACYESKIKPGKYFRENAKDIINTAVVYLERIVYDKINKYDEEDLLYKILLEIEELEYRRFYAKTQARLGINTYIEYDPVASLEETMDKVLKSVKSATYLLEFTLKNHNNNSNTYIITNLELSELIAIGNEICTLYLVSDNIYYKIWSDYGVEIMEDCRIQPVKEEPKGYKKLFRKNISQQLSNKKDLKISDEENKKYWEGIDKAFENDLSFKFTTLLQVLGELYSGEYDKNRLGLVQTFSNIDKVAEVIKKYLDADINDIKTILEFLTLKGKNIKNYTPTRRANDEYKLRTKPLIEIDGGKIIFGRFSVYKTFTLWEQSIFEGLFPYSISSNPHYASINTAINKRNSLLDKELEKFIFESLKGQFSWDVCEKNLDFYNRFGKSFPSDLGDYDAFCISLPKKTIILVEAKNLRTPFMPNEIEREFKFLFYKTENGRRVDYSTKFIKRIKFVKNNVTQILELFGIKSDNKDWKVKNYFVIRNLSYNLFNIPDEFKSIKYINLQDFVKEINLV